METELSILDVPKSLSWSGFLKIRNVSRGASRSTLFNMFLRKRVDAGPIRVFYTLLLAVGCTVKIIK